MDLLKNDIRPSQIITRASLENAITSVAASGGSTNAVLHLLAIARDAGVPLTIEDFDKISAKTPLLADLTPGGRFNAPDMYNACLLYTSLDQNRALWDQLLIHRGLSALARAEELSRALGTTGTYTLQAAIAACHARAVTADATDWPRIAALYSALAQVAPSPIVELNRAVAVGMAEGPAAGLAVIDAIANEPALKRCV